LLQHKVWLRHGSQETFKKIVSDKGEPGTFVGFEGTHVVRILTEKVKIIRATAAHFQEKRTDPPGGAKRQCLNPLDEDSDDVEGLSFRTAWFNEDGTDEIQHEAIQETKTSRRSTRLQAREYELSEESIRHRDIRNQTTIASLAYNTISYTFALLSNMLPNELY
jgi:hypothetical protein